MLLVALHGLWFISYQHPKLGAEEGFAGPFTTAGNAPGQSRSPFDDGDRFPVR